MVYLTIMQHLGFSRNYGKAAIRTVHFGTFGPSTLTLLYRPLLHLWSVHFGTFGPLTLELLNRPVWLFWTVHFDTSIYPEGPSTFCRITVYFDPWQSTLTQKTVHYRPLWLKWPSTFTLLDRPLWTWLLIFITFYFDFWTKNVETIIWNKVSLDSIIFE